MVKRILPFLIVFLTTNAFSQNSSIDVYWLESLQSPMFDLESLNSRGKGMVVSSVFDQSTSVSFIQEGQLLKIVGLKSNGRKQISLDIKYDGIPSDGMVISANKYGDRTFFGDNWPNRAHLWFACNDHPSDKATVSYKVTAPKHYEVIANGEQLNRIDINEHEATTSFSSNIVLPTKVMVIGVANFESKKVANPLSPIEISSWV